VSAGSPFTRSHPTETVHAPRLFRPLDVVSAWQPVMVLMGTLGVALSAYANLDPDVYWHRVLGSHWMSHMSLALPPHSDPITLGQVVDWQPTSWSVEVAYSLLVAAFGYPGIYALRLLLSIVFFALLARYAARNAGSQIATLLLLSTGLPISLVLQDRPQTFSLVFVTVLLPHVHAALFQDRLPPIFLTCFATWVWANVHGLWVLVPLLLLLMSAIRLLEKGDWLRPFRMAALCVVSAALTPVGPALLLSAARVQQASHEVAEWAPTALTEPSGWGLGISLGVLLVLGTIGFGSSSRVSIYVLVIALFGLSAYRNSAFASLLLCPVIIEGLRQRVPEHSPFRPVSGRTILILVPACVGFAAVAYLMNAGPPVYEPRQIADHLASEDRALRVVCAPAVCGYIRDTAGPNVRVSIDGRADRFTRRYSALHERMLSGQPGWRTTLASLHPDAVVVDARGGLCQDLLDRGWVSVESDQGLKLLEPAAT
jgi:hypothetical protein